jgi:hypothetical protein
VDQRDFSKPSPSGADHARAHRQPRPERVDSRISDDPADGRAFSPYGAVVPMPCDGTHAFSIGDVDDFMPCAVRRL